MAKIKGLDFDNTRYFDQRAIAIDTNGVPWVIDPAKGEVFLAHITGLDGEPKSAVVKKRK
jgi:hypothetical protein